MGAWGDVNVGDEGVDSSISHCFFLFLQEGSCGCIQEDVRGSEAQGGFQQWGPGWWQTHPDGPCERRESPGLSERVKEFLRIWMESSGDSFRWPCFNIRKDILPSQWSYLEIRKDWIPFRWHCCKSIKETSSAQLRSAQIRSNLLVALVWLGVGLSLDGVQFTLGFNWVWVNCLAMIWL